MANLSNIDWQALAQQQQQLDEISFKKQYLASMQNKANKFRPTLSYMDGKVTLSGSTSDSFMDRDELWNDFQIVSHSAGLQPDLAFFENQVLPSYQNAATSGFLSELNSLKMKGVPMKHIHKMAKGNPEFAKMLQIVSENKEMTPEQQAELASYIPGPEGGIAASFKENPAAWIATGGLASAGGKMGYDWYQAQKAEGKLPKWLKGKGGRYGPMGLFGAHLALPGMLSGMGATDEEIQAAMMGIDLTAGGLYGSQFARSVSERNLARKLTTGNKAFLEKRAKALGIETKPGGKSLTSLQLREKILEKVVPGSKADILKKVPQTTEFYRTPTGRPSKTYVKSSGLPKSRLPKTRGKVGALISIMSLLGAPFMYGSNREETVNNYPSSLNPYSGRIID